MSFEARNALMLAKKVLDKAAEYKKVAQKKEGGAAKSKVIPHGDKKREDNLATFLKGNHPEVPHVAYHGTTGDFSEFLDRMAGSSTGAESAKLGHWFTDNPRVAKSYADYAATHAPIQNLLNIAERYGKQGDWEAHDHFINEAEKLEKSFAKPEGEKQGQNIIPVHLSMKKPYIIDAKGEDYSSIEEGFTKQLQHAKRRGHDGVIVKNLDDAAGLYNVPANHYLVFNPTQIKSATGNQGTFDPTNPDITKADGGEVARKTNKIGLYSKAAEQARQLPSGSVPAAQLIGTLRNKGGIKAEELANAGITDQAGNLSPEWQSKGKIAPEELAAHFDEHLPEIEETVLGKNVLSREERQRLFDFHDFNRPMTEEELQEFQDLTRKYSDEKPTKYHNYTLPGGEDYQEILLRLPNEKKQRVGVTSTGHIFTEEELSDPIVRRTAEKIGLTMEDRMMPTREPLFKSSHWDDPDVVAHIRWTKRRGPNGEKILHVEEVQSDWGQKGKKEGFAGLTRTKADAQKDLDALVDKLRERVGRYGLDEDDWKYNPDIAIAHDNLIAEKKKLPDRVTTPTAPYVTSTQGWTDLALKRILKEAAEGGYDKVVWTPGEEQAKRYDLSKHIDSVKYSPAYFNPNTGNSFAGKLTAYKNGSPVINKDVMQPDDVAEIIGKDLTHKLLQTEQKKGEQDFRPYHYLEGEDLSVGGEGMKDYYDKILPKRLQEIVKRHDKNAKIGVHNVYDKYDILDSEGRKITTESNLESAQNYLESDMFRPHVASIKKSPMEMFGIDITPQMRESILKGQEGYARGGDVMHTRKVPKPHTPVVGERQHQAPHPASMIPGIHVVGAIHGIPYFTGKK